MNSFQEWVHNLVLVWVNSASIVLAAKKIRAGWVAVVEENTTPWNDSGLRLLS